MTIASKSTAMWSSAPSVRSPATAKNALFAESGGEHWAIIASLIETKLNGIDPRADLTNAIARIANDY